MVKPAERNTRYVDAVMTIPKVRRRACVSCPKSDLQASSLPRFQLPLGKQSWPLCVPFRAWLLAPCFQHRPSPCPPIVSHNCVYAMSAPQGTLFPMCGMNLAFDREAIGPAMYFGLMGEGQPWGRYDGERGVGAAQGMVCAQCALLPIWCRMLCHEHASRCELTVQHSLAACKSTCCATSHCFRCRHVGGLVREEGENGCGLCAVQVAGRMFSGAPLIDRLGRIPMVPPHLLDRMDLGHRNGPCCSSIILNDKCIHEHVFQLLGSPASPLLSRSATTWTWA